MATIRKKLSKVGNSFCIIFDKQILKLVSIQPEKGTELDIEVKDETIIIRKATNQKEK